MRHDLLSVEPQHLQPGHGRRATERHVRLPLLKHLAQIHLDLLERLALRLVDAERPRENQGHLPARRLDFAVGEFDLPGLAIAEEVPGGAVGEGEADEGPDLRGGAGVQVHGATLLPLLGGQVGVVVGRLEELEFGGVGVVAVELGFVHEAAHAAQGAVDEALVDVLDQHHLRALLELETLGRHAVGQETVPLRLVLDAAAVAGIVRDRRALQLLHACIVRQIDFVARGEEFGGGERGVGAIVVQRTG